MTAQFNLAIASTTASRRIITAFEINVIRLTSARATCKCIRIIIERTLPYIKRVFSDTGLPRNAWFNTATFTDSALHISTVVDANTHSRTKLIWVYKIEMKFIPKYVFTFRILEKHKTYHMKDEQLLKDGFKKFLKTEPCRVEGCRFTMICNHIHCVRTNCSFVLHSSGQLLSHKRKHERMDAEMAYRRFKMGDTAKDLTSSELAALQSFHGLDLSLKPPASQELNQFPVADQATTEKFNKLLNNATLENLNALLSHTVASTTSVTPELLKEMQKHQKKEHCRLSDRGLCKHDCDQNAAENVDNLEDGIPKSVIPNVATSSDETKSPSAEEIEQIISQYFTDQCTMQQLTSAEPLDLKTSSNKLVLECFMFKNESHLHCLITGCEAVVPHTLQDISEHLRMHELNQDNIIQNSNLLQITSIEGFFNRKRGRPPKNRVVEVYNNVSLIKFGLKILFY